MRRGRLLVAFDELAAKPAKHVIGNAGRAPDIRIFGKPARFETLVGELLYQAFQGYSIL